MAKSKVQKAKGEQGYITKIDERDLKCDLGGFVMKKRAVCNVHKPKKTIHG